MYKSNVSFYPEQPLSGPDFFKRILMVLGLLVLVFLPDFFFGSHWHSHNMPLWVLGVAGALVIGQSFFRKIRVALTIDYGQELVILSSRTLLKRSEWVADFRELVVDFQADANRRNAVLVLQSCGETVRIKEGQDGFSAKLLAAIAGKLAEVKAQYV